MFKNKNIIFLFYIYYNINKFRIIITAKSDIISICCPIETYYINITQSAIILQSISNEYDNFANNVYGHLRAEITPNPWLDRIQEFERFHRGKSYAFFIFLPTDNKKKNSSRFIWAATSFQCRVLVNNAYAIEWNENKKIRFFPSNIRLNPARITN